MTQYMTYNGDVTHMKGQRLRLPRFKVGGGLVEVLWDIIDVVYDFQLNISHVTAQRVEVEQNV